MDCKGILTPIFRTWVQKITLLLQNRGHAEVLKKDPFFREIRNEGAAPSVPECPPPPGEGAVSAIVSLKWCGIGHTLRYRCNSMTIVTTY